MNNLQMSFGNSKQPLCFTLGKVELSFNDKYCKKCRAPKKFWIPPPGRTTKFCQCCFSRLPDPPTQYTVNIPANELLTSNTPFTIESSNIDKFKMLFTPVAAIENNNSQNTPETSIVEKVIENLTKQKNVVEGAEKVLKDNEQTQNTLSEEVKLLKKNMNEIDKKIKEISNQDKVYEEKIDVTQMSSTESNRTKSVATIARRKEIKLQRKSTKETLRSEILRVENLLKNVQKLTESNLKKEAPLKVKTLETLNSFDTDQTDSDPWVQEDFRKSNYKTMSEKSTTHELIQSLQLPTKNKKTKAVQTSFLRPVPMIKFQPTKQQNFKTQQKLQNRKQNRPIKQKAVSIPPKREVTMESVMTAENSMAGKFQNQATVENLMKKLADSMRKSKKLLDSIYRQDGIVESMQNRFIQQVENLYQDQQSMLKDLYDVSMNSTDPQTFDGSRLEPSLPSNEWIQSKSSIHPNETCRSNFSCGEALDEMHTIENTLAKAQEKLTELKTEYNEMSKYLCNGSMTQNNALNKSATIKSHNKSKTDSAYSTMKNSRPNDIVYETVIKQTMRNVTMPDLTKNNINSPLSESIQNINNAVNQLLPTHTNDLSESILGMTPRQFPLESWDQTPKKSVRKSDKFKPQAQVMKPASERFNYAEKDSSLIESFGPLPEYPFNDTDTDHEESGASQKGPPLRKALSDQSVTGITPTIPPSSLPEYQDWAKAPPQDFSTPKKTGMPPTSEDDAMNHHHHHHHHRHHQAHHGHHDDHQGHHHGQHEHHEHHHGQNEHHHGQHEHHHGQHEHNHEHHQGHHHGQHEPHKTGEHHVNGHARHDMQRLRRRIDKLYDNVMSS